MKVSLVLALLSTFAAAQGQEPVKVSVYYEALCPDSKNFIKRQLYPAWLKFNGTYMNVDFIPYGKASQTQSPDGSWRFSCQHGALECQGNMIQGCALSELTEYSAAQVQFVSCVMSNSSITQRVAPECARSVGIDYSKVEECASSIRGQQILAAYGDRTHNFRPRITFIPTIAFNDEYSEEDQDEALTDLVNVICRHINGTKPDACS